MARDPGGPGRPLTAKRQQWRGAVGRQKAHGPRAPAMEQAASRRAAPGQKSPQRGCRKATQGTREVPGSPQGALKEARRASWGRRQPAPGLPRGTRVPVAPLAGDCPRGAARCCLQGIRRKPRRSVHYAQARQTRTTMHSRWNDADARKAVESYAGRASARTWRCAPTPRGCWAATRCWCCTAAATPRSRREMADLLGETHEVLCVKGSGWDMGTIEPAGLPAVKLGAAAQAARARDALRRGHGQLPARQPARCRRAQPVGGDAAARLPAAHVHRPHACRRRAEPGRPAERRGAGRRGLRRHAWASCPTSSRASGSPSWRPRCSTPSPTSKG